MSRFHGSSTVLCRTLIPMPTTASAASTRSTRMPASLRPSGRQQVVRPLEPDRHLGNRAHRVHEGDPREQGKPAPARGGHARFDQAENVSARPGGACQPAILASPTRDLQLSDEDGSCCCGPRAAGRGEVGVGRAGLLHDGDRTPRGPEAFAQPLDVQVLIHPATLRAADQPRPAVREETPRRWPPTPARRSCPTSTPPPGKLAQLRHKVDEAIHAGPAAAVEKQHARGKGTARERIDAAARRGLVHRARRVRPAPHDELRPGEPPALRRRRRHRLRHRRRPPGLRVLPGLHGLRRQPRRGVRREDRQGHGLRACGPAARSSASTRAAAPASRRASSALGLYARDLQAQRARVRRDPADLADHGAVRRRRRSTPPRSPTSW